MEDQENVQQARRFASLLSEIQSLEELQRAFAETIPRFFELPAGAMPLREISEKDIQVLQACFKLPEGERYSTWAWVLHDTVWRDALRKKEEMQLSSALVAAIEKYGLPLSRSFLMVEMARQEAGDSRAKFKHASSLRRELQATEREGKELEKAVSILEEFFARAEDPGASPRVLGQRVPFRFWRHKDRFKELLAELGREIESAYRGEVAYTRYTYFSGTDCPENLLRGLPHKKKDLPPEAYLAYAGVLELARSSIRNRKPEHNRKPEILTSELFALAGVRINDAAARQRRRERPSSVGGKKATRR